jgi:hypothetical protein
MQGFLEKARRISVGLVLGSSSKSRKQLTDEYRCRLVMGDKLTPARPGEIINDSS